MSNSIVILSAQTHPGGGSTETHTGEKFKGDGYYGRSDGFHTVQSTVSDFVGSLEIQGTLSTNPTASDWFPVKLDSGTPAVDTTGKIISQDISKITYTTATSNVKTYNFTGNYVFVRAVISNWTAGTVNSIKMNH